MVQRDSSTRPVVRGILFPFFLVLVISVFIIGGLVVLTQRSQDRIAIQDSVHLAQSVLRDIQRRLADQLLDYSYWDQAVENLVRSFDAEWADRNVGIYMNTRFNIASSYVLDAENSVVYGMDKGKRSDANPFQRFEGGLDDLVAIARQSPKNEPPVPATGLLWDGETAHIVAVSVLTDFNDEPGDISAIATNSVLIFSRALDSHMLSDISKDYMLEELATASSESSNSDAAFPLIAADKTKLGYLTWRVESPTREMMEWLLPVIGVVFIVFAAIAYVFIKRMQDTAMVLVRSKEETEAALERTERARAQLVKVATIDHVTGLPNRALLFDRVEQAIEHAKRNNRSVGLVFVDLDQFKHINDTKGHAAGDQLLKQVGKRLCNLVRQGDTVARLGGDEFIILLHDVEMPGGPEIVAMKTIEAFSVPFDLDGHDTYVTASLGVSVYPDDGKETEMLLQHADAAMYKSKRGGRNTFHLFTPGLKDQTEQQGLIAERFRHAVDRDELDLHFQPIIDLTNNRVTAVEALIRWSEGLPNLVDPEELMSVAEETGFVVPIENWVLGKACAQLARWRESVSPSLKLNVNVSGAYFRDPALVETVKENLIVNGLPPESIMIELTENFLTSETSEISKQVSRLSEMGVRLALDDFGKGYSSLRYLRKFQINTLKIDRHFVRNIESDKGDLVLVEAIISMAHSLDLAVVAEGVETASQLKLIGDLGCELIQGFYFSEPLPADQMTSFLTNYQTSPTDV